MRIYCDGIFDLFHAGHVKHFKLIKTLYPQDELIVGVTSDADASQYKRKPIYKHEDRLLLVSSCKYVDDVISECFLVTTQEFMDKHNIDLVVHAFKDDVDYDRQKHCYPITNFQIIPYNQGISTTDIIGSI